MTREQTYRRLAAQWEARAFDWLGRTFIYGIEQERELERVAWLISFCYLGLAEGRQSRYRTVDSLKSHYEFLEDFYEGVVEDMKRLGDICPACHYLREGDSCGCEPTSPK